MISKGGSHEEGTSRILSRSLLCYQNRERELNLKYQLEMSGIEYPKTHDIDQLLRIGKENGADLLVTEYIEDHSEMFSLWEARTRYVLNYHLEERKIDVALKGVKELLDKTSDL